jgi:hypothetical protein
LTGRDPNHLEVAEDIRELGRRKGASERLPPAEVSVLQQRSDDLLQRETVRLLGIEDGAYVEEEADPRIRGLAGGLSGEDGRGLACVVGWDDRQSACSTCLR